MKNVIVLAALWAGANAFAQQPDSGCQVANVLLGALFNAKGAIPCDTPAQTGQPSQGTAQQPTPSANQRWGPMNNELDTPENLVAMLNNIRKRYEQLDLTKPHLIASDEFCMDEMQRYRRYSNILNSGYDQLQAKCQQQSQPIREDFVRRNRLVMQQQKEFSDQQTADSQMRQKKKEADERAVVVAELRSGKRAPNNCSQYMVTKGHNNPEALDAPVMVAAYQSPTGIGRFMGVVDQINDDTFVISGRIPDLMRLAFSPPDNTILIVGKEARVFDGQAIQVGALVQGFATQTGTRTVKLANGRSSTVAVMRAACLSR
ncbi:MAG: hypothetical protein Q8R06_21945 [Polaromonas sp.]|uniref:hypothetical protein n=1 Tax=Polaromonas sp. TaxID=1869339 RepID=UPI002732FD49|nr:hypothetical protein [Polaromonas sp.]MDP3799769.1 hypothetical protein [Polaromonas sp.]